MEEIENMRREVQEQKINPMEIKKRLAVEIIKQFHPEEEAIKAREHFEKVFSIEFGRVIAGW